MTTNVQSQDGSAPASFDGGRRRRVRPELVGRVLGWAVVAVALLLGLRGLNTSATSDLANAGPENSAEHADHAHAAYDPGSGALALVATGLVVGTIVMLVRRPRAHDDTTTQ